MKKAIPFIIALPALLLLFAFKLIPAFFTVIISMKYFNGSKGIYASPSAGFGNYSMLFGMEGFPGIVVNTLRLSIFSIALTCIFAVILIICISRMPWRWLKLVAIALLAIPAFVPIASFVWVFSSALSPDTGVITNLFTSAGSAPGLSFGNPAFYPFLFANMDSLRNVYIPVILGVLVCENSKHADFRKIALVIIGYVAARATMLMSPDIENILVSSNPLVAETSNVLDSIRYYSAHTMQFQLSVSSAAWVFKTVAQLLISIIAFFALKTLAPSITRSVGRLGKKVGSGLGSIPGIIGYILFATGSITVIILTFIPTAGGLSDGMKLLLENKAFVASFVNSLLYCIFICILYGFVTLLLAYPLSTSTKLYPLLLLILISLSNNFVGEYIWYHNLGMINTIFPIVINSGLSIVGAFALHFCVSAKLGQDPPDFVHYVKASLLPLFTIVAIAFITNWGSYLYQSIYVIDESSLYGVGLCGRQILFNNIGQESINTIASGDIQATIRNAKSAFVFLSSIIPAVLGAILIGLHKFLPLSAFAAQIRKG